jgi:hypothetical protein
MSLHAASSFAIDADQCPVAMHGTAHLTAIEVGVFGILVFRNEKAVAVRVPLNPPREHVLAVGKGVVVFLQANKAPFTNEEAEAVKEDLEILPRQARTPLNLGWGEPGLRFLDEQCEDLGAGALGLWVK